MRCDGRRAVVNERATLIVEHSAHSKGARHANEGSGRIPATCADAVCRGFGAATLTAERVVETAGRRRDRSDEGKPGRHNTPDGGANAEGRQRTVRQWHDKDARLEETGEGDQHRTVSVRHRRQLHGFAHRTGVDFRPGHRRRVHAPCRRQLRQRRHRRKPRVRLRGGRRQGDRRYSDIPAAAPSRARATT